MNCNERKCQKKNDISIKEKKQNISFNQKL